MHLLLHHPQVLPAVPLREFKGTVSRDYLFPQTAIQPKAAEIILEILLMHLLLHHPQVLPAVPPREFKGTVSRDYLFPQTAIQPNPFISITSSKPLMSSGSWLTLHYCYMYYLSAVNYVPVTTDLIFIRVSIYPGPGKGGLQLILKPIYFIRVTIYPATFPHNISRGHYLPRGGGGG